MSEVRHGGVFEAMPPSTGEPPWVQPAIDRGHDPCPDPPSFSVTEIARALSQSPDALSGASRFTCRKCGATALKPAGVAYGRAFERDCI